MAKIWIKQELNIDRHLDGKFIHKTKTKFHADSEHFSYYS